MVRQMKREKGITLIALTITIIILLILASVTTYSGISTIQSSKLNKYKQELEIMQSQVNVLYEKYNTEIAEGQVIDIGEELTNSEQENDAFSGANENDRTGYKRFTEETMEELGIDGIEREYLVNIAKRQVISLEPFEQEGKAYYTLAQLSDKNTIETGIERGNVEFSINTNVKEDGLEVIISNIQYSKYVGKGSILYQKVGSDTWRTLVTDYRDSEYSFTIKEEGEYHIKIVDAASVEKVTDNPILVALGNYVVDNTRYFDTLVEAVAASNDGSVIKVIKDTEESEFLTIDKDITIDMNGKTITYTSSNISIDSEKNVVIDGNGTLKSTDDGGNFIINNGNLDLKNSTISSGRGNGSIGGTISNLSGGNLVIDNSHVIEVNGNTAIVR